MYVRKSDPESILPFTPAIHLHETHSLDAQLATAQPRLRRIVRLAGIPAAMQDDVVQETLLAAWRNRQQMRQPERFDAWLDAICRNQCRMFWRANAARPSENLIFLDGLALNQGEADEIADPQALDPLDDLDQQETIDLIARALTHLTPAARQLLTLRYLADLPEREVAAILRVSVPVLEARMHRARRQLRAIMEGPLHDDLFDAGLLPINEEDAGWQTTSLWCNLCGKRHMLGRFETDSSGMRELRLRCPICSPASGFDVYGTKGMPELAGMKSIRPALNRSIRILAEQMQERIATGIARCSHCGATVKTCILGSDELPVEFQYAQHFWSYAHCICAACGAECRGLGAWTVWEPVLWFQPAAQKFMRAHPRWFTLPEIMSEWQGRAALRFQLADAAGSARFIAFADPRTLEILGTFEE